MCFKHIKNNKIKHYFQTYVLNHFKTYEKQLSAAFASKIPTSSTGHNTSGFADVFQSICSSKSYI